MSEEKREENSIQEPAESVGEKTEAKQANTEKEEGKAEPQGEFPVKFMLGRKAGMGRIFDADGNAISVTFIEAGPCRVTQIKTVKNDGYNAVQLAFGSKREKLINKPLNGHLKKSGLSSARYLREVRIEDVEGIKLGQSVTVKIFSEGDSVNITGISKGLGFQGGVRRHKFGGGPKTHGQSDRLRAPGSVGASSYPSRVFKGQRMAGRMGKDRVTVKNLKVIGVDAERNYLLIKGAVPGKPNGLLSIYSSSHFDAGR